MKRVMIIGAVGAGKSTLVKALFGDAQPARKTQALEYHDWIIDTPGEYTENPLYYRSLMATSLEAGLIMLVHDATRDRNYFPPGFAQGFPIPAIGVVTRWTTRRRTCKKLPGCCGNRCRKGKFFSPPP
jgi:ethanolamine utilization protein EutP